MGGIFFVFVPFNMQTAVWFIWKCILFGEHLSGIRSSYALFCNIECIAKWKFNGIHLICGRLIIENPKNIDLTNWISALVNLFQCYFYCCFSTNQKLITNQFTIHDEPINQFHWKLIKGINYYLHNGYRTTFDWW